MAHVFISYSRQNQAAVERLRHDLQQAALTIWIDRIGLQPGTPDWDEALRTAIRDADAILLIASPDSRRSPYVRDEVALAKAANKPIYPVWIDGVDWLDCIPMGLGSTQNIDLRGDQYAGNLPRLVGSLLGTANVAEAVEPIVPLITQEPEAATLLTPRNPYKGLRAFRQEDAGDFFGRDTLIDGLLLQIEVKKRAARLLAVLGASGGGKSSVMMAGVLPKLREKHPDWVFLDPMVPGANPLEKLTITLSRQFGNKSQAAIREDLLDRSTRGLHGLVCELGEKPVVLYIDQFEELFTLVDKEPERRHFIDLLTTAATTSDGVLSLLLSMRADFYDRPAQYREFGALIEKHHTLITPMTLADLYDVIQKPAELSDVRLRLEDGLATEMVFAVREEAAALPLLQFTLDQLFERREGNTLTMSAYAAMGRIQGALAQHADATYRNLPSDQHRSLARALFLRLIEPGQTEQDTTRRRATYSELILPDAEQTRLLAETADAFVNARLLVSDQSGDTRTRTLEVSHEALIREWSRLGEWLHSAREDLRLQKSLSADVAEWLRRGRPADMLYRGTVLAEADRWTARNVPSRDETMFLHESEKTATEHRRLDEARKEQELVLQRRAANRLRYLVIGLAVFLVVAVGLSLFAFGQQRQAENEAANAEVQAALAENNAATATHALGISELRGTQIAHQGATSDAIAATAVVAQGQALQNAATSEANLVEQRRVQSLFLADLARQELRDGSWNTALNLGLQSFAYRDQFVNAESYRGLMEVLVSKGHEEAYLPHNNPVLGAAWNSDETRLLTWGLDGTARTWNPETNEELLSFHNEYIVYEASWSADDASILTAGGFAARVWDANSGDMILSMNIPGMVFSALWNKDETRILTFSADNTARIWDGDSGDLIATMRHQERIRGAKWSDDESQVVTWSDDTTARTWDAETGVPLLLLRHDRRVLSADWNSDNSKIITQAFDGSARIWDATTGEMMMKLFHPVQEYLNEYGVAAAVIDAQWSSDESRLLTLALVPFPSSSGYVNVWDAQTGELLFTLTHEEQFGNAIVNGVRWNNDESRILTWSSNFTARIWDAHTGENIYTFLHDPEDEFGLLDTTRVDEGITDAVWSADESLIMTSASDGTTRLWDVITGKEILRLRHQDTVRGAKWNNSESRILTWSLDGTARVWNTGLGQPTFSMPYNGILDWNSDKGQLLTRSDDELGVEIIDLDSRRSTLILNHLDFVDGAKWNADYSQILTRTADSTVHLWDVETADELFSLPQDTDADVTFPGWNADETQIMTFTKNPDANAVVNVWDASNGNLVRSTTTEDPLLNLQWRGNDGRILTLSADNVVSAIDAFTGELLLTSSPDAPVTKAEFVTDYHIAIFTETGELQLSDLRSGENIWTKEEASRIAAVSKDQSQILLISQDDTISLIDVDTGEVEVSLEHDGFSLGEARFARWNDDESIILTAGGHATYLWDAKTGELLQVFENTPTIYTEIDEFGVSAALWNEDESLLLTVACGETVIVWDAKTGEELLKIPFDNISLGCLTVNWNDEGTSIYVASGGNLQIWDIDVDSLIAYAEKLKRRDLNNGELEQFYLPTHIPTATVVLPSLTPAPTLTASPEMPTITPLPTLTPSVTPTSTATATPRATIDLTQTTATPSWTPTLTPLPVGEAQLGENRDEIAIGERDTWVYEGRTGEILTIRVNADRPAGTTTNEQERVRRELLDTYLLLWDDTGQLLDQNDDIDAADPLRTNSMLNVVLPADGKFYIEVRGYQGRSGGAYTLIIEQILSSTVVPTHTPTASTTPELETPTSTG